jgi:predicted acylesterase/phospholipase RssA
MEQTGYLSLGALAQAIADHRRDLGDKARVAYVLHPGGAAGAYQAGALEALALQGLSPDLIFGTSIGAFNGLGLLLNGVCGAHRHGHERPSQLWRLWRRLSRGGRGSRLLLDKPWLLALVTGRPDWRDGLLGDMVGHAAHLGDDWRAAQQGLFATERLRAFTLRVMGSALGLGPSPSATQALNALNAACSAMRDTGVRVPTLVTVATDVASHAAVAFVLGDVGVAERLTARGHEAVFLDPGGSEDGGALEAFYASSAIPGVFPPTTLRVAGQERVFIDGALANSRPYQLATAAGATLIVSLEVEAPAGCGPYLDAPPPHFVSAAVEAFMTIQDHYQRHQLAALNQQRATCEGSEPIVRVFRLAPDFRLLSMLEFDGHYQDGQLICSLFDAYMAGFADAGGTHHSPWANYISGLTTHGDTGRALNVRRHPAYWEATFIPYPPKGASLQQTASRV